MQNLLLFLIIIILLSLMYLIEGQKQQFVLLYKCIYSGIYFLIYKSIYCFHDNGLLKMLGVIKKKNV